MIFNHPLIQHKIGIARNKNTSKKEFREILNEISMLMAYEVTRDIELKEKEIETPMEKTTVKELHDEDITIVPILRAGLGMVDGILKILPTARVGHLGLYRDEDSYEPVPYYSKLPSSVDDSLTVVLDPMLATGGTAIKAISYLKEQGVKRIKYMCIIASKPGIYELNKAHHDIDIYAAALDEKLDDNKYIVPGLGDAGDRLFGTK